MTLWLDAQLDPELAAWLGSKFKIVVKSIREVGLRDADDDVLFAAARRLGQIVILTKDHDFVELVERLGAPPPIIWLRCPNMRTVKLQSLLSTTFENAWKSICDGEPLVEITVAASS